MKHIKHMKLSNGTEIVADIVEWPTEEEHSFVIRNVYEIHCVDNELTGRFFQFRTWMVYQDQQQLQVLNPEFVMAEANPTEELLKHYYNAIEAKELTDEELAQRMKEHMKTKRLPKKKIQTILYPFLKRQYTRYILPFNTLLLYYIHV